LAKFFLLRTLCHEHLKSHRQDILSLMIRTVWYRIKLVMANCIYQISWLVTWAFHSQCWSSTG